MKWWLWNDGEGHKVKAGKCNSPHFQRTKVSITPLPPLNTGTEHFYVPGSFLFTSFPAQALPFPLPRGVVLPYPLGNSRGRNPDLGSHAGQQPGSRAAGGRAGGAGRGRRGSGHPRSLTVASKALLDPNQCGKGARAEPPAGAAASFPKLYRCAQPLINHRK